MDFSENFVWVVTSIDTKLSDTDTFGSLLDSGLDHIKRMPLFDDIREEINKEIFTKAVARRPTLTEELRAWTVEGSQYLSKRR